MSERYIWHRIDPATNRFRFYTLGVERDLWGNRAVVRRWGRLDGSRAGVIVDWTPEQDLDDLADAIHQRRTAHHYELIESPSG